MIIQMCSFGGGGGKGATLTVHAPAGCTVTVSKDGKSKTKIADAQGLAVFKGLETGQWAVTITDGEQIASKNVTIVADYNKQITFFSATIHITYPAGSACTVSDGVTTLTAPDTSGTWDCVVPNAGTWTVTIANGEDVGSVSVDVQRETDYLVFIPDQSISWDLYNPTNSTAITDTTRVEVDASNAGTTIKLHPQASTYRDIMARTTIDLTNWSQVIIDAEINVEGAKNLTSKLGFISDAEMGHTSINLITGYNTGIVASGAASFNVNQSYDISSLSGEYYFCAYAYSGSSNTVMYSTIKINSCIFVR